GLQVSARLRYEGYYVSGPINSPLGFEQDPNYASAVIGFQFQSFTTVFSFIFVITNTKVYALLSYNVMVIPNTFVYIIPVANRYPEDFATYSITIESQNAFSWRINNHEVLRISPLTQPIDPRFQVAGTGIPPSQIT